MEQFDLDNFSYVEQQIEPKKLGLISDKMLEEDFELEDDVENLPV